MISLPQDGADRLQAHLGLLDAGRLGEGVGDLLLALDAERLGLDPEPRRVSSVVRTWILASATPRSAMALAGVLDGELAGRQLPHDAAVEVDPEVQVRGCRGR